MCEYDMSRVFYNYVVTGLFCKRDLWFFMKKIIGLFCKRALLIWDVTRLLQLCSSYMQLLITTYMCNNHYSHICVNARCHVMSTAAIAAYMCNDYIYVVIYIYVDCIYVVIAHICHICGLHMCSHCTYMPYM